MKDLTSCVNSDGVVTFDCLPIIIENVIFWLLVFAGIVALYFIIFSGIKLLTSQGEPDKVASAKKTLTWALVGLVLVLMSVGIVRIIAQITDIPIGALGL